MKRVLVATTGFVVIAVTGAVLAQQAASQPRISTTRQIQVIGVAANNQSHGLGFFQMFEGVQSSAGLMIEVVNNTITGNRKGLVAPVDGIFVHNNILFGNEADTYRLDEASDTSVLNNLFGQPGFVGPNGNIEGDPAFVAAGDEDFHLQSQSPALHAGTPKLAPTVDIEGSPRDAAQPDIGAFESGATTVVPSSPTRIGLQ